MTFKTDRATGNAAWSVDVCRIAVTLRRPVFVEVQSLAVQNNRSISAEIRTMVDAAIAALKKPEGASA